MRGSGEATARRHEDDLLGVLISRNPNGMRPENLRRHSELTDEEIHEAALRLRARGLVRVVEHENVHQPGRVIRSYVLSDPAKYPVRESVRVGDVEFPRSLHGDLVGAEDLNGSIEANRRVQRDGRESGQEPRRGADKALLGQHRGCAGPVRRGVRTDHGGCRDSQRNDRRFRPGTSFGETRRLLLRSRWCCSGSCSPCGCSCAVCKTGRRAGVGPKGLGP
jgi:hypothetical protein